MSINSIVERVIGGVEMGIDRWMILFPEGSCDRYSALLFHHILFIFNWCDDDKS
jgi:hypothetical protein